MASEDVTVPMADHAKLVERLRALNPWSENDWPEVVRAAAEAIAAWNHRAAQPVTSAAPGDRNAVLSEIEDMHKRAWSRECERGNLDRAEWHRECAGQMRAMKGERP